MKIPKRKRGRPSAAANEKYQQDLVAFCAALIEMANAADFKISARGFCYLLEEHGLFKTDFDYAENLINDCRKDGNLPVHFTSNDTSRRVIGLSDGINFREPDDHAAALVDGVWIAAYKYKPFQFWDDQQFYLELLVEKIDLKSIFEPVCSEFFIPIGNSKGWADINSRADMMQRFAEHERDGRQCVLLYCGDHDPGGLNISNTMMKNLKDLTPAVGWNPENLIIDRFGLNADFIESAGLTWIDNLKTGAKKEPGKPLPPGLDSKRHKDHFKPYVQNYIAKYGVKKCEANSLVINIGAGRQLCRDAITEYVPEEAVTDYNTEIDNLRALVVDAIPAALRAKVEDL